MRGQRQTRAPHALQKLAPGALMVPQRQQYCAAPGPATMKTCGCGSVVQAQTMAMIQPMNVQPKSKLTRKMPSTSRLLWPTIVGRKYSRVAKTRNVMCAPFRYKSRRAAALASFLLHKDTLRHAILFPGPGQETGRSVRRGHPSSG